MEKELGMIADGRMTENGDDDGASPSFERSMNREEDRWS
jgi:hypothetical protein